MIRYIALGLLASTLVLISIIALVPSTDDFSPENPGYNGVTDFASRYRAIVISTRDLDGIGVGTVAFIIGPDKPFGEDEASIIRRYVERGGVLVIADDYGSGNTLARLLNLGVVFNGSLLLDPVYMYKSSALPIASATIAGKTYKIYMNYATFLTTSRSCIGYSSIFSYADLNLNGLKDPEEPGGPLCIAYVERIGSGYVYMISDPSIFINSMLGLGDNLGFIDAIIGGRVVYIVGGLWSTGYYAAIRSQVVGFLTLLFISSMRYPAILILSLSLYIASKRIYMWISKASRVPRFKETVDRVLMRHPEWDRGVVEKIAREVMRIGEEERDSG